MSNQIFTSQIHIKETDLDTFGHVNNARYLTLLEQARWDIVRPRGFGLSEIQKTGVGPVVLEVDIKFKRELVLNDVVQINTYCSKVDGKVCVITQDILKDEQVCVTANTVVAMFDIKARKIIELSKSWKRAIGIFED